MYWRDLDVRAREVLASARTSLLLVAPFVKTATLRELLTHAPGPGLTVQLYTRWRAEDVAAGVTDTGVLAVVEERGGRVRLVDELHAKLIAADMSRALVGSANLTAAGLGTSRRPNLEIMTIVPEPGMLRPFELELRRRSRPATAEEAARVEADAAELRRTAISSAAPDAAPPVDRHDPDGWLPTFRSPDRLFGLYSDAAWLAAAEPHDPALTDLADLAVPGGMNERGFMEHVRTSLLSNEVVQRMDALLVEPTRFGVLSALVGEYLPHVDRRQRQRTTQTLIRWMLYFVSDRYGMRTPSYSEILFRH